MRNAQDIRGRGNHSQRLALNYIFSDCKLLLTAPRPSLQLTFLTKGHLLAGAARLRGGVEPARGDQHPHGGAPPGPRPGPCEGEEAVDAEAHLPGRARGAGCSKPTGTCLARGDAGLKHELPGLLATTPGFALRSSSPASSPLTAHTHTPAAPVHRALQFSRSFLRLLLHQCPHQTWAVAGLPCPYFTGEQTEAWSSQQSLRGPLPSFPSQVCFPRHCAEGRHHPIPYLTEKPVSTLIIVKRESSSFSSHIPVSEARGRKVQQDKSNVGLISLEPPSQDSTSPS